jgi:outer membrane lipoprotein LolB
MIRSARAPLTTLGSVLLILAGCVSVPPPKPAVPSAAWPERRAQLQALESFSLDGRVAVAAANEGFNARLEWQQKNTDSVLQLSGPIGVGGVRVVSSAAGLSVTTPKGERLDSDAARAELRTRLGFEPPLASLRYWVLGVPDPGQPATETVGADQHLAKLEQDGWDIEYSAYTPASGGSLPQRLSMQRGTVHVRLFVSAWHI